MNKRNIKPRVKGVRAMPQVPPEGSVGRDLIWGAAGVAQELGVTTRKAIYLLERRLIPGQKIGAGWVVSREALRAHFAGTATKEGAAA